MFSRVEFNEYNLNMKYFVQNMQFIWILNQRFFPPFVSKLILKILSISKPKQ